VRLFINPNSTDYADQAYYDTKVLNIWTSIFDNETSKRKIKNSNSKIQPKPVNNKSLSIKGSFIFPI
jgi:hypothetical protein